MKNIKKTDGLTIKFTKKEVEFLNSILEAQKYKIIFALGSNKNTIEENKLQITNKLEGKLNYVLGY